MTLFGRGGRIIATATADPTLIVPEPPPDTVLLQVRQGRDYVGLEPIRDAGFHIRAVVRAATPGGEERLLQALFPVTDRLSLLADAVQAAFDSYKELIFLRAPLKASFTLTLSLALLLAVLAAFWAAFHTARRLVQPLAGTGRRHRGGRRRASSTSNCPAPAATNWVSWCSPSTR